MGGWEFLSRDCSNDYFFGRSLVRPWFFVGLLHETKREGTKDGNLNKSTFGGKVPEYNSGVIDIERREIKEPPEWMALLVL